LLGPAENVSPVASADVVATIEHLVDAYQRAGLEVALDLHIASSHRATPSVGRIAIWSAVYRIAQESLANAVRHAPGQPVCVTVATNDDAVDVRVTNPIEVEIVDATPGNGVAGMRERARLCAGTFACGPVGGHWIVECSLPLEPPRTAPARLALSRR
jgi:signal transduction histidine kinase